MGTPGAWTTDDPTDDFYYSLNTLGPHHWFIVMDMDCDQTQVRDNFIMSQGDVIILSREAGLSSTQSTASGARRGRRPSVRGSALERWGAAPPSHPLTTLPGEKSG